MNNYTESKKKIESIRNRCGEIMFRMAISHLMDVGIRHLTEENVEEGDIFQDLETIKELAHNEDYESVNSLMEKLLSYKLEGEDKEFMEALSELVSNKEKESIIELVNTYFALKL